MCLKFDNRIKFKHRHKLEKFRLSFDEHENVHFDFEEYLRIMLEHYEESGFGFDLDLVTILYYHMLHILRSFGYNSHVRPIYLLPRTTRGEKRA